MLGLDSDEDHNRAVLTLVGPGEALIEAVFRTMRAAVERIDLRRHDGTHPRIGAVDVVPFVPWHNADMMQAVTLAHTLGERVALELQLPVYFYGEAALTDAHRRLPQVRRGQFEGLDQRMAIDPPDRGPQHPHPSAGAVAIGARRVLIAFNVYLNTTDVAVARAIARAVRGSSGGLVGVQALAMDMRRQGRVQVSMNLTDYPVTSLPRALEFVRREASQFGVTVVETEVVGMMPLAAVEDVMRYYLQMPQFGPQKVLETALRPSSAE
jgi:glutamate formiminotransferase